MTDQDMADALIAKGWRVKPPRLPYRGIANCMTKLSAAQALRIFADPRSINQIAKSYNLASTTVSNIKKGITWRTVTGAEVNYAALHARREMRAKSRTGQRSELTI